MFEKGPLTRFEVDAKQLLPGHIFLTLSVLQMIRDLSHGADTVEPPVREGFIVGVGKQTMATLSHVRELIAFSGEVVVALGSAVVRPTRVRWKDCLLTMQLAGVNAFPVVFLINFLCQNNLEAVAWIVVALPYATMIWGFVRGLMRPRPDAET